MSGVIVAVLQLVVFPKLVKVIGITIWQRVGCLMCIPSFVAIPNAKRLSWNDGSLFMVSVVTTTLVYCFLAMVRPVESHTAIARYYQNYHRCVRWPPSPTLTREKQNKLEEHTEAE